MTKNIWILNHYTVPPIVEEGHRHNRFSRMLQNKGYNVLLFHSSYLHRQQIQLINNKQSYLIEKGNQGKYIGIKTRSYFGNGKERVLNMLDYAIGVMSVSKKIDNEKPDIIYTSSPHPLTWISGYLLSKRYNTKFIAETRDLWPETLVAMGQISKNSIPAKVLYKLEKFIYKRADKLIFTFPGGKDYVESIGLDSSKVRYINNGIDIEEFNNNKENNIYDDVDLDEEDIFKVLYTGAMGQANELSYLIKAAELIQEKGINNIKFILFGDGYEREKLERYVKDDKINNVIFKGKVEKSYIPNILSKSDLNIFTGKHIYLYKYGLSLNKMFEYFGSGKPTLSNIECGYDILEKYNCGITVEGGSPEALAEGILKFYNMPKEEYNVYCENALNAAKDFDFKVLTDKLEKVILEA